MADAILDQLTTPLTQQEIKAVFAEGLAATGVHTTNWKPGGVTRTLIAIITVVVAAFSTLLSEIAKSAFLGTASPAWAWLISRFTFGVTPQVATFASGPVLLSNASGIPRTFATDALLLQSSITSKMYRNAAPVTIGAGAVDVSVAVSAVEVGSASSALVGEVDTLVPPVPGLTCRNAGVLVGLDDEALGDLQARCALKLQPYAPRGPATAYEVAAFGARRANGTPIGINRLRAVLRGRGRIDVYVATPSGGVTGTLYDLGTDLGCVDEAIQTQAVPLAVTADTHSAANNVINVAASVWVYNTTGLTETQLDAAIRKALAEYFESPLTAPIGGNSAGSHGYIFAEDLRATIMRARANDVPIRAFRCNLESLPDQVLIGEGEVPKLGSVTLSIVRVAPPSGSA